MPRYFKLGASKNSDRDTYLFQGPDPISKHSFDEEEEESAPAAAAAAAAGAAVPAPAAESKWAPPFLRRAQSTRERPVVTPPQAQAQQQEKLQLDQPASAKKQPPVPLLQRAASTREQRKDLWARVTTDEKLGPLEAAVQRGFGYVHKKQNGSLGNTAVAAGGGGGGYGFKEQEHLPRAQSMRYNRIVSSEEEVKKVAEPPRHSSFAGDGYYRHTNALESESDPAAAAPRRQKLVVVSASYQTGEGEILSIECAKCGRWLGTVAQRVSLDEGMLKLCQICHPLEDDGSSKVVPSDSPFYEDHLVVEGSPGAKLRKGNSFVRGLRKMLGLKKKPLYSFTAT